MMADRIVAPVQTPHSGNVRHGIACRIPWRIHEKAWQVYAKYYSGQSAERMAERGGFGLVELIYLLAGENPFETAHDDPTMFTDFFGKWSDASVAAQRKEGE